MAFSSVSACLVSMSFLFWAVKQNWPPPEKTQSDTGDPDTSNIPILGIKKDENRKDNKRFCEENARLRQELVAEIREGNQRILDALYNHRHDPGTGATVIYPPQAAD